MKSATGLSLVVLLMVVFVAGAKKGKKDRKSGPQWKPSSMPAMNKRFESVFEGKDLSLDCRAQGHPKPSVRWLRDGAELKDGINIEVKKFSLILTALTSDMSGNYTCVVSNKHGQIDWTFHLDVQGESPEVKIWPLIIEGPNNITQTVGSNVAFRCKVLNDPQATVRWLKTRSGNNIDDNSPQPDFLPGGDDPQILTLDNIKKEDEGEYRCMAGNVWGLKYSSAWLTVIEPVIVPDPPRPPPMDNNNRNNNNVNINNNNIETESTGKSDQFDLDEVNESDEGEPLYEGSNSFGGLNPSEYDSDLFYTTTKRPKNSKNRTKNGKKKDKKSKDKNLMEEDVTSIPSTTTFNSQSATTVEDLSRTTFPIIWHYERKDESEGFGDSRYTPVKSNRDETEKEANTDSTKSTEKKAFKGSISSWTIYTIVGAIGGVILLIGLVAITLTLCCRREENSVYKSTSV